MKNVLSLGAGIEQIPSIIHAREMGLFVIVADGNKNAPGLKIADIPLVIDIKNTEEIIAAAKKYSVSCLLPVPIGRYLTTIGRVNDHLGLKGISGDAAVNCTDKRKFNALLAKSGLNYPHQIVLSDYKELKEAILEFGIPCVIKPRHGSGSKGVMVIDSNSNLEAILEENDVFYPGETEILVEQYINGRGLGVDGYIDNHEFHIILIREKEITPHPYKVETAYFAPAPLKEITRNKISIELANCAKSLGINNSPFHADIVIAGDQTPYVIEMSGRPSGLFISQKLVPLVTGFDFIGNCINMLLDKKIAFLPNYTQSAMLGFFNLPPGKIIKVPEADRINTRDYITEYVNHLRIGEHIEIVRNVNDLIYRGYYLLNAPYEKLHPLSDSIIDSFIIN